MNTLIIVSMILITFSYLSGCVSYSVIISKAFKKTDIRKLGNGNPGASNTVVNLGWKYGVAVGALDIFKAVFPILLAKLILTNYFPEIDTQTFKTIVYFCGGAAIIGHVFSVFLMFKGGKGTASLVGTMLAIDIRFGLIGAVVIILITLVSNYIALGTMGLLMVFILGTVLYFFSVANIIIVLTIASISFIKHCPNFVNIKNGTEKKLMSTIKK
ncbi:glycerol-3-phosphate acyltransferase [Oceanirhabdus sp. W0125-5]|uniref:glycerol-3-phosphate acyltransferase n=1 Tax=Oceanirhabdus sp. W0125-5 TaxID=2999116 RepID=UPI0022F2B66C|nr:glycerol-3-phosphate acyltransferase [Oceanirhabdus sp. W0125-5]WBW96101.1 glycerol-3-phosphate acyltransferase [Oceanirhabdus sp. W0125-5]